MTSAESNTSSALPSAIFLPSAKAVTRRGDGAHHVDVVLGHDHRGGVDDALAAGRPGRLARGRSCPRTARRAAAGAAGRRARRRSRAGAAGRATAARPARRHAARRSTSASSSWASATSSLRLLQPQQAEQPAVRLHGQHHVLQAGEARDDAGQLERAADARPRAPARRGGAERPAVEEDLARRWAGSVRRAC